MNKDWTDKWPTVEGWYVFYGWTSKFSKRNHERDIHMVEVVKIVNGTTYVTNGQFIYPHESEGVWSPLNIAAVPEYPQHFWRDLKIRVPAGVPYFYDENEGVSYPTRESVEATVQNTNYERRRLMYRPVGGKFGDERWVGFDDVEVISDSPKRKT